MEKSEKSVCTECREKAVMSNFCRDHFIKYFEKKVNDCIDSYNLVPANAKILVGVSGGKDSLTVLYLLNKRFPGQVTAYAVDEGISGYRDKTLKDVDSFCSKYKIPLIKESFEGQFDLSIDSVYPVLKQKPCSVCGVFRRYLLNKHREFDILATGHNLDDEAQSIVMNLLKNQVSFLAKLGPKSGLIESESFLQRIKPLYFCTEKEVMAYAFLHSFKNSFVECPHAKVSFRIQVRDGLNNYEYKNPGTKKRIVENFINLLPSLKEKSLVDYNGISKCSNCGEASRNHLCKACELVGKLKPLVILQ